LLDWLGMGLGILGRSKLFTLRKPTIRRGVCVMRGVWYIPDDFHATPNHVDTDISTDEDFFVCPTGIVAGEQFRSFCFWLGQEGEDL
jgi:hypothetical protein